MRQDTLFPIGLESPPIPLNPFIHHFPRRVILLSQVYTAVGWVASSREIEIEMIMLSRLSQMRNRGAVAQAGVKRVQHAIGSYPLFSCMLDQHAA